MSEDSILKCLIAFILGWFLSRHMGNGFSVGGGSGACCTFDIECGHDEDCQPGDFSDFSCGIEPGRCKKKS